MREIILHKNVKVIVGDRFGGVSEGAYESLNLGFHVGDEPKLVKENQERFALFFGVNAKRLCFMEQIHKNGVKIVTNNDKVRCDAIVTQNKELVLCVMTADCVPIVLYDDKNRAIAAIHAGRQGAFLDIVTNTLKVMQKHFNTHAQNVIAFIGPSIKACCYEIYAEALNEAQYRFDFALETRKEKRFLDLQKIIRRQLSQNGVEQILDDNICTCCDKSYFSHRRDGICGRFAVGIKLL